MKTKKSPEKYGIDIPSKFSSNYKEIVENDIHKYVSSLVRDGLISGYYYEEELGYRCDWNLSIIGEPSISDYREIADKIKEGYISGHLSSLEYVFYAKVSKKEKTINPEILKKNLKEYLGSRSTAGGLYGLTINSPDFIDKMIKVINISQKNKIWKRKKDKTVYPSWGGSTKK